MAGLSVAEILDLRLQRREITPETYGKLMARIQPKPTHTVDTTPTPLTFDPHGRGAFGVIPLLNPEPLPEAPHQPTSSSPSDDIASQFADFVTNHPSIK